MRKTNDEATTHFDVIEESKLLTLSPTWNHVGTKSLLFNMIIDFKLIRSGRIYEVSTLEHETWRDHKLLIISKNE